MLLYDGPEPTQIMKINNIKVSRGIIVLAVLVFVLTAAATGIYSFDNQIDRIWRICLEQDKIIESYEKHHKPQIGVYYKIQGYSGDSENKEYPSSFFIVTTVEFNSRGDLCENCGLKEIQVPQVVKRSGGELPDYLYFKYVVFESCNGNTDMRYLKNEEEVLRHKLGTL